jgi:hypothetical protein
LKEYNKTLSCGTNDSLIQIKEERVIKRTKMQDTKINQVGQVARIY